MGYIAPIDLVPFAEIAPEKALAMIADAEAMATLAAPCLATLQESQPNETPEQAALRAAKVAAVKAILRGAIVRWSEAGTGALTQRQQTIGPAMLGESIDTRQRRQMFTSTEIGQLQGMCAASSAGAFSVDLMAGR